MQAPEENMDNFVVVVFPDEEKAHEGKRALEQLHREGVVTVYETAVLQRASDGTLTIARGLSPLLHTVVRDEFLERIQRDLGPGKSAVLAEVREEEPAGIDQRMMALGGTVSREARKDFVGRHIEESLAPARDDLASLAAAHAGTKAELMETKLAIDVSNTREDLERRYQRARQQIDHLRTSWRRSSTCCNIRQPAPTRRSGRASSGASMTSGGTSSSAKRS
jgi:uncharacterized membrane protein